MKNKVIWSPSALDDIKKIFEYIAKDSPDRGALFIERLIESTNKLESFPYTGRIIVEINQNNCREIIYGSYRIMYEISQNIVKIAAIVHSAQDWKPK